MTCMIGFESLGVITDGLKGNMMAIKAFTRGVGSLSITVIRQMEKVRSTKAQLEMACRASNFTTSTLRVLIICQGSKLGAPLDSLDRVEALCSDKIHTATPLPVHS